MKVLFLAYGGLGNQIQQTEAYLGLVDEYGSVDVAIWQSG